MTRDPLPRISAWFERGIDVFFVAVTVTCAVRGWDAVALGIAVLLLALYAVGVLPRRTGRPHTVWLCTLTGVWAVVVLFVSVDFVWVSVPVLFLHLLAFPLRTSLPVVALITGVVIVAEVVDDGLTLAEVAGPVLGAGFAIVACASYRSLATEHERTRRALDQLDVTRHELARSEHERGMLDERRRVAREVHDTVAQDLASILLLARSPRSADTETRIEALAATALQEARRIVDALGPLQLEAASLPTALARLGTEDTIDGPGVEFTVTGTPRELPQPHEAMLLRVAQGALANSREHASASTVFVTLSYLDDEVAIDVVDDGLGFALSDELDDPPFGSFGLSVMRQRAAQVGGTLVVESRPGSGTAVHAAVPTR